jgi:4-amino-4-deoxy-L-arabinose transferase-like glycosyltransferase
MKISLPTFHISKPHWPRTEKGWDFVFLTIIILAAIALRVGITYNTLGAPNYWGMATDIGITARNLAEGKGYVNTADNEYLKLVHETQAAKNQLIDLEDFPDPKNPAVVPYIDLPPGPSSMLAFTYLVFGEYRYIYWRLFQAIIGAFGCLFMFLLAKELFNRKVGLIAAAIYAVYLPITYLTTWALGDALIPFFALVACYLFVLGVKRKAYKYYVISAIILGIGMYFQISLIFLLPGFTLGYFIYNLRKRGFWKMVLETVKVAVTLVVVFFLVLSPWIIRNYIVSGKVMLLMRPGGGWQGIWEGAGEYENPFGAKLNDVLTYEQVKAEYGPEVLYGSPEFDAVLKKWTLDSFREYPGWWVTTIARRIPRTIFYGSDLGINRVIRDAEGNVLSDSSENSAGVDFVTNIKSGNFTEAWNNFVSSPYTIFVYGLVVLFMLVTPALSFIGVWLARRRWRNMILVLMVPFSFALIHLITFINWKTLVPGTLFYILFDAVVLYWLAIKLKIIHDDMSAFKREPITIPEKPKSVDGPVV